MVEAANNDAELIFSFLLLFFCLSPQSKEVGVQLQEDLMKVLNELYTVRENTDYMWMYCHLLYQWRKPWDQSNPHTWCYEILKTLLSAS